MLRASAVNIDPARLWLPCPRVCHKNTGSICTCDAQSDRLSCSFISTRIASTRADHRAPVLSYPGSRFVGIVLEPNATKLMCSYATDMGSSSLRCGGRGVSQTCVPGCMAGNWCREPIKRHSCSWRAADLEWMLRQFEGNRAPYNEAVVEAASWLASLPRSLEAIYFHDATSGDEDAPHSRAEWRGREALARRMHASFVRAFGLEAGEVALLRFDRGNLSSPFAPADLGVGQ